MSLPLKVLREYEKAQMKSRFDLELQHMQLKMDLLDARRQLPMDRQSTESLCDQARIDADIALRTEKRASRRSWLALIAAVIALLLNVVRLML